MAKRSIDTSPTGDTLKQGFDKSEANFAELYSGLAEPILWEEIEGKPEEYPPAEHSHDYAPAGRETFTTVALLNSATQYIPSTYGEPGFYKNAFGRVHLQGMVTTGGLGSVLFQLPVEARPAFNMICATIAGGGFSRLDITSNGNVTQVNGNTGWVSLTGITFMAAEA